MKTKSIKKSAYVATAAATLLLTGCYPNCPAPADNGTNAQQAAVSQPNASNTTQTQSQPVHRAIMMKDRSSCKGHSSCSGK